MSVKRSSLRRDHQDRKNTFLKKQLTLSQTCGILIEVQKCTKQKRGIEVSGLFLFAKRGLSYEF